MIAAIYARKSDDNADGVELQVEIAADFIASKGWTVGPIFSDNYSDNDAAGASFLDRPGHDALLTAVAHKPRPFNALVMMDGSRIGRRQSETLLLQVRITKAGVRIFHYQSGNELLLATSLVELITAELEEEIKKFRDAAERNTAIGLLDDAAMDTEMGDEITTLDPRAFRTLSNMYIAIGEKINRVIAKYSGGPEMLAKLDADLARLHAKRAAQARRRGK